MDRHADYISWDSFQKNYLSSEHPSRVVISQEPIATLSIDPRSRLVSVELPRLTPRKPLPDRLPLAIRAQHASLGGQEIFQILLLDWKKARPFLSLVFLFRDLLITGSEPENALALALMENRGLLENGNELTEEEEKGLFGELWYLNRLVAHFGSSAIDAWTGAISDSHDFRLSSVELELKTSQSTSAAHWIHGLTQLVPSPGKRLFLISLLIADSGSGRTGDTVLGLARIIDTKLAANPTSQMKFRRLCTSRGLDTESPNEGLSHFIQRQKARMIEIDDEVPVISLAKLSKIFNPTKLVRVQEVQYKLSFDGLGFELESEVTGSELRLLQGGSSGE